MQTRQSHYLASEDAARFLGVGGRKFRHDIEKGYITPDIVEPIGQFKKYLFSIDTLRQMKAGKDTRQLALEEKLIARDDKSKDIKKKRVRHLSRASVQFLTSTYPAKTKACHKGKYVYVGDLYEYHCKATGVKRALEVLDIRGRHAIIKNLDNERRTAINVITLTRTSYELIARNNYNKPTQGKKRNSEQPVPTVTEDSEVLTSEHAVARVGMLCRFSDFLRRLFGSKAEVVE